MRCATESVIYNRRVLVQTTVGEPDTRVVEEFVYDIEEAMYVRWQELARGPADEAELQALKAAADDLLAIKVHKLGWPDPRAAFARLDVSA